MVVRILALILIWTSLCLNVDGVSKAGGKRIKSTEKFLINSGKNPGSDKQEAYIKLVHLTVSPAYYAILESHIRKIKPSKNKGDDADLFATADFADQKNITFLIGLDWKADLDDLEWRITNALKQNFNTKITYPSRKLWLADASVSSDHVFSTYDKALRKNGFQLGFIENNSDDYMMLVFKTSQENRIKAALKVIGYGYHDASKI